MIFYLVRHGEPGLKNIKTCLGCRTDPGLSPRGREQAGWLREYFFNSSTAQGTRPEIFSSPQRRSLETAALIAGDSPVVPCPGLREQDMGVWDGLTFREIQERYPALYKARGADPALLPPEAEPFEEAAGRMLQALSGIANNFTHSPRKEIIAVTHAGSMRALLCRLTGKNFAECRDFSLPYGSVTELSLHDGTWHAMSVGVMPADFPDERDIKDMLRRAGTPEQVAAHCRAVAGAALEIARDLADRAGCRVNAGQVRAAALLHDVCRTEPHHAAKGADLILRQGYPAVAEIVRRHHRGRELSEHELPDEADIVFYADKIISETRRVSLEERFAAGLKKCLTPEAVQAHGRQKKAALSMRARLAALTGRAY